MDLVGHGPHRVRVSHLSRRVRGLDDLDAAHLPAPACAARSGSEPLATRTCRSRTSRSRPGRPSRCRCPSTPSRSPTSSGRRSTAPSRRSAASARPPVSAPTSSICDDGLLHFAENDLAGFCACARSKPAVATHRGRAGGAGTARLLPPPRGRVGGAREVHPGRAGDRAPGTLQEGEQPQPLPSCWRRRWPR